MIRRLREWWKNRPCYTEVFIYNSAQHGEWMTCEEADRWYDNELKWAMERNQFAHDHATRSDYV